MRILISIFLLLVTTYGSNIELDLAHPLKYFGQNIQYYEDKESVLNIEAVKKLSSSDFSYVPSSVDSRLFTESSIWYKFDLKNSQDRVVERYFIFDLAWIDEIHIYIEQNDNVKKISIGNDFDYSQRSYDTHLLNAKHDFEQGLSTVYMKVKTQDPFVVPFSILNEKDFLEKTYDENSFQTVLYSVIGAMMIFNLILFFLLKNRAYLYYSMFLASFILMNMSYNNLTYQYFWSNSPLLQNWMQSSTIFMYCIMGLAFSQSFLNLKKKFPPVYKLTIRALWTVVFCMIVSAFFGYHYHIIFSIIWSVIFSVYVVSISLYCWINGDTSAKYFFFGTIFGLIGTSITALSVMAYIPYEWYFYKAIDFGIIIDTMLLSIALANRYKIINDELRIAHSELDVLNKTLERKVEDRTQQLEKELKNKGILLKEIFHRVKNNLQMISALFLLQVDKVKDETAKDIIHNNVKRIKVMSILHEKLFLGNELENINFKEYIQTIILEYSQSLDYKNIEFEVQCDDSNLSNDNLIPFGLILNELITNSLKYGFTEESTTPKIDVDIKVNIDGLILIYKDNGVGFPVDFKEGFGLKLLRSLVEHQLNGTFTHVTSSGTENKITFPKSIFE